MKIGQPVKCHACGASSLKYLKDQSLWECRYCGAHIMQSFESRADDASGHSMQNNNQHKPLKLSLLLVLLPILVVILMVVFWQVFVNIREHPTAPIEPLVTQEVTQHTIPVVKAIDVIPEKQTIPATSENSVTKNYLPSSSFLQIDSEFSSVTQSGGMYWVFRVSNSGQNDIYNPAVMVSLFDSSGSRVAEQGGWAHKKILKPGEHTPLLVFISEPPDDVVKQEVAAKASETSLVGKDYVEIVVTDYNITEKNGSYEFIGDVTNDQSTTVKYIRVVAVALNEAGEPVGIGNAFSSNNTLAMGETSGFKVKVGTFLTAEPKSWKILAMGKAQL